MVGKIKRVRQKLHVAAIKVDSSGENAPIAPGYKLPGAAEVAAPLSWSKPVGGKDWTLMSSDIFSSTTINPEALTQNLEVEPKSIVPAKKEEKIILSKKEKTKQRRERWLQKIESLKLAQLEKKAQAKRKATPVVGDLQALVDALPELSELTSARKPKAPRKQPKEALRKKKPEPTDYSKMKPGQKRKIMKEEISRIQELVKNPSYKASPLTSVTEHLIKRMKAEQEDPS
ncbi:ribosome biogenesis protein SLX9 homolog [Hyla sarda]|uniref:ribosome biogenesis protein SLX9 homolog n=1 Tax=Hyla sarda TaxID=327740 RepID=UPI0024C3E702|nr:ribosome biogenesis protein SLX9 homolog [Hyla sarda]